MEKWTREDLLNSLAEFSVLYSNRPIKDNNGGMKSPHMFPAWFIVKKLKPKILIESGVWKGLGTWFFEQASPTTQIISIDPEPRFRIYTSQNATYYTEDFLNIDWSWITSPDDVLVFFDDHQDCLPRIKKCRELNFNKIIVEDNYPPQQGDCYTPKKILSDQNYVINQAGNKFYYQKNDSNLKYLKYVLSLYQEMPPIFKSKFTRWGDAWDDNYPTPEPLMLDFAASLYPEFYSEKLDYTWICYMELNKMFTSKNESDFFLSKLKPEHYVLEYGSGSSTTEIAQKVKQVVSIEHQEDWYLKIKNTLPSNVELILSKPNMSYEEGGHCGTYEEFETYVNSPVNRGPFDIIYIDGRARVECAKLCSKMATKDTLIFIHDFDREEYQSILSILEYVEHVETMYMFKIK